MDDLDERDSASSAGESERDNEPELEQDNDPDEVMEDVDDGDNDATVDGPADADENNDEEEEDGDPDGDNENPNENAKDNANDNDNEEEYKSQKGTEGEPTKDRETEIKVEPQAEPDSNDKTVDEEPAVADDTQDTKGKGLAVSPTKEKSATPAPVAPTRIRPAPRPEAITARIYDIVPTMAAPQSTSINAMAITPDLRYWFTGGSDGYIRKYDGPGTINGKLTLTVAQKHPFVDSVTKAGILMSYWENEEPAPPGRGEQEHILSPVYSLAVESDALWLLSGLESGGINLQSVRHDEGKKITCLQQHSNAVSVLTLAQDEKSVLSGSWDKSILDWDLNTGKVKRSFDGTGGQISAIELRPASGDAVPAGADDPLPSDTMSGNNGAPPVNGSLTNGVNGHDSAFGRTTSFGVGSNTGGDGGESPAHESLFGGSDAGSLFGETAEGEQPFGQDEDVYHGSMDMHEGGMDHSADMLMAGMEMGREPSKEGVPAVQPPPKESGGAEAMDVDDNADANTASQMTIAPETTTQTTEQTITQADGDDQRTPTNPEPAHADATLKLESGQENDHQEVQGSELQEQSLADNADTKPSSPASRMSPSSPRDPTLLSSTTFLSAAMDGTIRLWDRRVQAPIARISTRSGVPPWCMSAVWSPDGNMIYAGRRNGTVEEYDVRKARRGWEPERVLKFPAGSGAVSALKPMANGRHLVCASHDILRLYDLRDTRTMKHSSVPFLIVPGPPRAGVIASLYVDPTSRFMLSAAGTRGWEGTSTEALIGYEIGVPP